MATSQSIQAKKTLDAEILRCRKCPVLGIPKVTPSAPGHGSLDAKVMIVGRELHRYNPATPTQIPFVGPVAYDSGNILFEGVQLGLAKDSDFWDYVFITNMVHCNTPRNRPCTAKEIKTCAGFLRREFELVQPALVIGLGAHVRKHLFGWSSNNWEPRSVTLFEYETLGVAIFHPSYWLRTGAKSPQAIQWREKLATLIKEIYGGTQKESARGKLGQGPQTCSRW